jgi:hypothetical protein
VPQDRICVTPSTGTARQGPSIKSRAEIMAQPLQTT